MTKSTFRSLWLVLIFALLLASYLFIRAAQKEQSQLYRKEAELARLKVEQHKTSEISRDLTTLDKKTISEADTTQLGILRHLNLEQNEYDLSVLSKQELTFSETVLSVRNIKIEAEIAYKRAMELIDNLHATGKINLTKIEINKASGYGDKVKLTTEGTMYGIYKYE